MIEEYKITLAPYLGKSLDITVKINDDVIWVESPGFGAYTEKRERNEFEKRHLILSKDSVEGARARNQPRRNDEGSNVVEGQSGFAERWDAPAHRVSRSGG